MKWLLAILLFCLLFAFGIHTITDINQDLGRHLVTGKIIWQTHEIPQTNLFSYTYPDFETPDHHWLSQVIFYLTSAIIGLKGLILFQALILTGAFILAFLAFYYKKSPTTMPIVVGLLSVLILADRSLIRPEIFSFLFFGWYLFVLFNKPTPKFLWSLPIVQLVWINTHIYFFLGPMAYLFFLVDRFIKNRKEFKKIRPLFQIGIAIALVNFINPFGWKGAIYPFLILKNYGVPILENMNPFEALSFGYPAMSVWALVIAMALTLISFIINWRNFKRNIFEILLTIALATLSLIMLRNMPVFALVILPVVTKNFYESRIYWNNKLFQVLLAATLGIMILAVMTNQLQAGINRQFGLKVPEWGQKAIDFVIDNRISGPVFNNINTGSLLLWKIPGQKIFIDSRPEAYPADFVREIFIPMQSDPEKWKFYSERYNINYVFYAYKELTPWSQKFIEFLSYNDEWPIVYLDDKIVIFIKNTPENSEVIKKYQIHAKYNLSKF